MSEAAGAVAPDPYHAFLERKRVTDPMTGIVDHGDLSPVLKPHQHDIVSWALRRGRAAVFAGTGLGKTLMELSYGAKIVEHTGKPVLCFAPLAVASQHVREAGKFGLDATITDGEIGAPGVYITNYQKMDRFDLSQFGGVILDECFAPDTAIETVDCHGNLLEKDIENIKVGDRIVNAAGIDTVSDVHRREVPYAVRLRYAGRSVVSSPNHPFFTQRGWVGAQDLLPTDRLIPTSEAMRMVQSCVFSQNKGCTEEQVLREILLSEMAYEYTGTFSEGAYTGSGGEARQGEVELVQGRFAKSRGRKGSVSQSQSDVRSSSSGKDLPPIERDGPRTFRAWWKRPWNDSCSISIEGCSFRELGAGVCHIVGPTNGRLSNALQTRSSFARAQNRYRGGWIISPLAETFGSEKRCETFGIRLDSAEILESGHPDMARYLDAEGKLYFYDLGGTRHPSFTINGALVHNSSILKNTDGAYRTKLIRDCAEIPFRLAATATPAPNDFMELGNHAEFLGIMSQTDMLATFFVHDGGETQKWRLKGHAHDAFWKWMASWAVMIRKPSDLGYDDAGYDLPQLIQTHHIVDVGMATVHGSGLLFPMEAKTLQERIGARRSSVDDRVAKAVEITPTDKPFVWWCNLNAESEALTRAISGAVEVRGADSESDKERKLLDFIEGRTRVLITKGKIAGWGLNFQHCADTGFIGASDSFEMVFQCIRRFWRFGQSNSVTVHHVSAKTEGAVVANFNRKERDADLMASAMVRHMAGFSKREIKGSVRDRSDYEPQQKMIIPAWLEAAE